jgi:predicted glycoside hydrolase/deacetylase ChbG (UPF0249 family)
LLVIADDFGIGPATSEGILELAQRGIVTGSVLMANSPYAEQGVDAWTRAGKPMELGWHPALTLDRPILSPDRVPSLVDKQGKFFPLATFVARLAAHAIHAEHLHAELSAQYHRCTELLGMPPLLINGHHHIHVFPSIHRALQNIISPNHAQPYLRTVREPWPMLRKIPGARAKRLLLNWHGRRAARTHQHRGLPTNQWLIGVTDAHAVNDDQFFNRLLLSVPGSIVELMCHPGAADPTLIGRDCTASDGMLQRRTRELDLLKSPSFLQAATNAGFHLISPRRLAELHSPSPQL